MQKQQLAMVIDSAKCINCKACVASCRLANDVPSSFTRNWIKDDLPATPKPGKVMGANAGHFQPGGCMHCDIPTCVQACPTAATFKDTRDGIVHIDRDLCIGCGNCIGACPYGARYRHPTLRVADKCNYCPERRAAGLAPACVDTCPTKARVFGDILDPGSDAAKLLASFGQNVVRVENQKTPTDPNMVYVGFTAPVDWAVPAQQPLSMELMRVATPALQGLVGLMGLGILVMGAKVLTVGCEEHYCEIDPKDLCDRKEHQDPECPIGKQGDASGDASGDALGDKEGK